MKKFVRLTEYDLTRIVKRIIQESQYDSLLKRIPISLKRRMSANDLEIINNLIWENVYEFNDPTITDSEEFVDIIITDAMHDFITKNKFDEIDEFSDDLHNKQNELYDIWWELTPLVKQQYETQLTIYYLTQISKEMTMDEVEDIINKIK